MKIERILAPIDFSEYSATGLMQAAELAKRFGAELLVLNVVQLRRAGPVPYFPAHPSGEVKKDTAYKIESFVSDVVPSNVRKAIEMRFLISAGAPTAEIIRVADQEEVDIIVMATHGRTGVEHAFRGSVAEKVVRLSRKPVWTVRKEALAFKRP